MKPLTPWVIAENNGRIISAHCDCMAGLVESCSHVASILWAVESGVRLRESMTVTQKKAYWVISGAVKDVPYAPVCQIKFTGKNNLRLNTESASPSPSLHSSSTSSGHVPLPTNEKINSFESSLSSLSSKPAILALVPAHSDEYVPKFLDPDLPIVWL